MTRTYDIHTLQIGFVMILFVDAHPITTLKGIDMDELTTIGRAWVDAAAQAPTQLGRHRHTAVRDYDQRKWDGIERRAMCFHGSVIEEVG